ncbi:MAG: RNA polymerase sigma factor [Treponema sp.]|nr:RNA polymerase sigma factor [Treponema sp.]MBQ1662179.1 RNA polymerase sigma factor [Treponema sp.]MBR6295790.1 RNA polymerase sigma factor [Treponema sp.]MEE3313551.1 RNA polymerase sigma factor [Treponema sp.]
MFTDNKGTGEIHCDDPQDFRKLYDATMQLLFKVSYRVVNDEEAAEDLVHDSFIKANEKKLTFPSMDDAKFWLIRVVKNASLNYAKRKIREANAYHKALYESRQQIEGGESVLLKNETVEKVKAALDMLPPKMKEVLVLREYGGLNYKEIGETLGITEGNVKVRVFRAREQLTKLIGEDDVYMP